MSVRRRDREATRRCAAPSFEFAAPCGGSSRQRDDIAVAVSEALTSGVLHGYRGRHEAGVLAVQTWVEDGLLQVIVCDEGVDMRPRFPSPRIGLGLIGRMAK